MLSKTQKGNVAQLLLEYRMSAAGLILLNPLTEDNPFDMAIFHENKFYKLQIKKAQTTKQEGHYIIPVRQITCNGAKIKVHRYTEDEVDFMCGVVIETGDIYCFPMDEIKETKAGITVVPKNAEHKPNASRKVDAVNYKNKIVLDGKEISLQA